MDIGIYWILMNLNMGNRAFCIGNGQSRKGFNLKNLKSRGVIVGCNFLYKDFAFSNRKCVSKETGLPVAPLFSPSFQAVPAISRCAQL